MGVFDIDEKITSEWLLANGWNWDSVNHKYVKNVYNLLIVSEGRTYINSLAYTPSLNTPHVVNLTLTPHFSYPWESSGCTRYIGRLDYCYRGSPWNTSMNFYEYKDVSELILWQETIRNNVIKDHNIPEKFIRL